MTSVLGDSVVTGGAGFIGTHLVRELLKRGASSVTVIDSMKYAKKSPDVFGDPRVTLAEKDFSRETEESLQSLCRGADTLFHLAAEKHNQSIHDADLVFGVNVNGTRRLFQAAARVGIKRIVFTSSLYAYGKMTLPAMREGDVPEPWTPYGISKLAGEHLLKACAKEFGVGYAIARLFFVFGPGQYPGMGYKSVIVKNFERILRGEPPVIIGDGTQSLDYLYVQDVVEGLLRAAANPEALLLNLSSGTATTILDLTKAMLSVAESRLEPVFAAPDWTQGTTRVGDPALASQKLQWKTSIPLPTGLRETYAWLKKSS
jgi:UDP-glucose 4-epimerase